MYYYEVREVVSGNQYSAFSNIAGGSVVQYTVNISLNSQQTGSQPAPWNDMNSLISNGFRLANMTDMNAQPTGINFNVVRTFTSFNDQLGVTTGNNSGIVPDAVMKTFYYNSQGDTARIRIDGLSGTGVFNFGFYAGTTFSNAPVVGVYQIGNTIVSLNAFNNTSNMVYINGVKPDSTGSVLITFYTGNTSPYAMWTSLTIQGMPSPDVAPPDTTTSGGGSGGGNNGPNPTLPIVRPLNPWMNGGTTPDSLSSTTLVAYPNPFTDNLTLKMGLPHDVGQCRMVITDANGKIVRQEEYDNMPAGTWQQSLYLGNLMRGIYYIRIYNSSGDKSATFSLMKIK
jgi:hypothetical protein